MRYLGVTLGLVVWMGLSLATAGAQDTKEKKPTKSEKIARLIRKQGLAEAAWKRRSAQYDKDHDDYPLDPVHQYPGILEPSVQQRSGEKCNQG